VSQDETKRPTVDVGTPITTPPTEGSVEDVPVTTDPQAPTIGTGTSIALGCVAGTIVLIIIGLIYIAIVAIL
jgi:hypothetical protein